jgi:hypothetical protein
MEPDTAEGCSVVLWQLYGQLLLGTWWQQWAYSDLMWWIFQWFMPSELPALDMMGFVTICLSCASAARVMCCCGTKRMAWKH